jgi:hypothetical protein
MIKKNVFSTGGRRGTVRMKIGFAVETGAAPSAHALGTLNMRAHSGYRAITRDGKVYDPRTSCNAAFCELIKFDAE